MYKFLAKLFVCFVLCGVPVLIWQTFAPTVTADMAVDYMQGDIPAETIRAAQGGTSYWFPLIYVFWCVAVWWGVWRKTVLSLVSSSKDFIKEL